MAFRILALFLNKMMVNKSGIELMLTGRSLYKFARNLEMFL